MRCVSVNPRPTLRAYVAYMFALPCLFRVIQCCRACLRACLPFLLADRLPSVFLFYVSCWVGLVVWVGFQGLCFDVEVCPQKCASLWQQRMHLSLGEFPMAAHPIARRPIAIPDGSYITRSMVDGLQRWPTAYSHGRRPTAMVRPRPTTCRWLVAWPTACSDGRRPAAMADGLQ